MKTLGRNLDNDLFLEAGKLAELSEEDAQCAIIESILLTQQGELQFDDDAGIDYFGTVLQSPMYIDVWAAQVRTKIAQLDFVSTIEDFDYKFDSKNSTLYWTMTIVNTDDKRLEMKNRKMVLEGSPGIDVSWDTIYDKPNGIDATIDTVKNMAIEAADIPELTGKSTLGDVKDVLDRIVFDANNPLYEVRRQVSFEFTGVPIGTLIDFSNLKIKVGEGKQVVVTVSDGTSVLVYGDSHGYAMVSFGVDEHQQAIYTHTITERNNVSIVFRGEIEGFETIHEYDANISPEEVVAHDNFPIFLTHDGKPFPYLTAITIGSKVPLSTIGDFAFWGFSNLQSVTWATDKPNEVTLGDFAFGKCYSLQSLTWIPATTTSIGVGCFWDCTGLSSIQGLPAGLVAVPEYCFKGCISLTNFSGMPETVTALGDDAFGRCSGIVNLDDLPSGISSFGNRCFKECIGLSSLLYYPESLTSVGVQCFYGCSKLESLYLPEGINNYPSEVFGQCTSLTNVLIEKDNPPSIPSDMFDGASDDLKIYVPPSALEAYRTTWASYSTNLIGYGIYQFKLDGIPDNTSLIEGTSIIESDSIWTVNFGDDTKVQRLTNDITGLPMHTYQRSPDPCFIELHGYIRKVSAASSTDYPIFATEISTPFPYLTLVILVNAPLTSIGDYTFAKCTGLSNISLEIVPGTEYSIGERAFYGCSSLHDMLWMNHDLVSLGEGCFQDAGLLTLAFGNDAWDRITDIPAYCFSNTQITTLEGIKTTGLSSLGEHCFEGCTHLTNISLLADTDVKYLPAYCFANCAALESLDGIEQICSNDEETGASALGSHTFENCTSLVAIAPIAYSKIYELSDYMFAGCSSLKSVAGLKRIAGTRAITTLGEHCFEGCIGLAYYDRESPLSDIAGTAITEIPSYCFAGCIGLQNLIGLQNIVSVRPYAFSGCTGLKAITGFGIGLEGIESNAFANCTGLMYVSTLTSHVPNLASNAFNGVAINNIPLYVVDGMQEVFSSFANWSQFKEISSRTIRVHIESLTSLTENQTRWTRIIAGSPAEDDATVPAVWAVDYGDNSSPIYHFGDDVTIIEPHDYPSRNGYDLTIFGDVLEIGTSGDDYAPGEATPPPDAQREPFLGSLATSIYSVLIDSDYLAKIGDFCFSNYVNLATLTVNMRAGGVLGAFAFRGCSALTTFSSTNIATIGTCAFNNSGVTTVETLTDVTDVKDYAFAGCVGLTSLSGLSSLKTIGDYAFAGCTSIQNTSGLSAIEYLGDSSFEGCTVLQTITGLGGDLNHIGENAFKGCGIITMISMPYEDPPVTEPPSEEYPNGLLAENVFENAVYQNAEVFVPVGSDSTYKETPNWSQFQNNIKTRHILFRVDLGSSTSIRLVGGTGQVIANGSWTISYGEGEDTFTYSGNQILPPYTFHSSSHIKDIKISGAVTSISAVSSTAYPFFATAAGNAFPQLKSVVGTGDLPLTSFGDYTFCRCSGLTSIENLGGITSVGELCFANCTSLTDVSGLSGVQGIGSYGFGSCNMLTSLDGLSSVVNVGANAFSYCRSLTKIDGLGMNITSIGASAFAGCPLEEVQMFATTLPTIDATSFDESVKSSAPLYVLNRNLAQFKAAEHWSDFKTIETRSIALTFSGCEAETSLGGSNSLVKSNTYWAVDFDDSTEIMGLSKTDDGSIPSHTYEFSGNYTVRVEGDITFIASRNCSSPFLSVGPTEQYNNILTSLEVPAYSSLKTIGDGTLRRQTALTTVSVPSVETLGEYAFAGCTVLSTLNGFGGVKTIGDYCFSGCAGIKIISGFGSMLNSIGSNAFEGNSLWNENPEERGYIQMSATIPPTIDATSFGIDETKKEFVKVYVPYGYENAYKAETQQEWKKFDIAVRTLLLTLSGVPANTTFADNTSYIRAEGDWVIDWGDGTVPQVFSSDIHSLPKHTYMGNGNSAGDYVISISGDIREIGAYSSSAYPFLVTTESETSFLSGVTSSEAMMIETIGGSCFRSCSGLVRVEGFNNVVNIKSYAFEGCSQLVDIGSGTMKNVAQVEDYAFSNCANIHSLSFLPHAYRLGNGVFYNDSMLYSMEGLGKDYEEDDTIVASFGATCFAMCPLQQINSIFVNPPEITATTFEGIDEKTIQVFVPANSIGAYQTAQYWNLFWNIGVSTGIKLTFESVAPDTQLSFANASITRTGAITIIWGDGTRDTINGTNEPIPSHTYTSDFRTLSVVLQGSITGIGLNNESLPFFTFPQTTFTTLEIDRQSGLSTIGNKCFYQCTGLTGALVLPSSVVTIGNSAFEGSGITSLEWGVETKHIAAINLGDSIFKNCAKLTTVTIHQSIVSLPIEAFANCAVLGTVSIYGVNRLGNSCFSKCTSLKNFNKAAETGGETIINLFGVSTLGTRSFFLCKGLENVEMPNATGQIGAYCFAGCYNLSSIEIPTGVISLGEGCFNCSTENWLTEGYKGTQASGINTISSFEQYMRENYGTQVIDIWAKYEELLYNGSENNALSSVIWNIPNGVAENRTLGAGCFMNCSNLHLSCRRGNFDLPLNEMNLTKIPDYCFYNCGAVVFGDGIADLSWIPDGVTSFGRFCLAHTTIASLHRVDGQAALSATFAPALFLGCDRLTNLNGLHTVFASVPASLPDAAFYGCYNLSDIKELETYVPVERLGEYCFAQTGLSSAVGQDNLTPSLPNVTTIGKGCFKGCVGIEVFNGLDKVTVYPTMSFADCTHLRTITTLCSKNYGEAYTGDIILEGYAFDGCERIASISFPYDNKVVKTASAIVINTHKDPPEVTTSSDPFPNIPLVEDGSRAAELIVSQNVQTLYQQDPYWRNYLGTFEGSVLKAAIEIPSSGGMLSIPQGVITRSSTTTPVYVVWGDGGFDELPFSLSENLGISHTYQAPSSGDATSLVFQLFGPISKITGKLNATAVSVPDTSGYEWVPVPFMYSELTTRTIGQNSYDEGLNPWITSIAIDSDITIGDAAFANFTNMTLASVLVTNTKTTTMGKCAFYKCESLQQIVGSADSADGLPTWTKLTKLDDGCFMWSGIQSLDFLKNVQTSGASAFTTLGLQCFSNCTSLASIENIPASFKTISRGRAFYGCSSLTSLYGLEKCMSFKVTQSATFAQCGLEDLQGLPATLTTITNNTFNGCTNLTSLSGLPTTVTQIGPNTFQGCSALIDISALENCSGLHTLMSSTFLYCTSLGSNVTSITIPSNITVLSTSCFEGCSSIQRIQWHTGITSLPLRCFYGCSGLREINLPNTITTISESCFEGCSMLDTVHINANITTIPNRCFYGCTHISYIWLYRWVSSSSAITRFANTETGTLDIETMAFPYSELTSTFIVVPTDALSNYRQTWGADSNRFGTAQIVDQIA